MQNGSYKTFQDPINKIQHLLNNSVETIAVCKVKEEIAEQI